jgi:NAD(P)-dependent dehydrogenase (short-subunit alcohol dehydrogenase family)
MSDAARHGEFVPSAPWLAGATVLVTGAGGGIGSAVCGALLSLGATVVGLDLDDSWLGRLDRPAAGQAHAVKGDVTVEEDVAAAVRAAVAETGRLDVVITAAGIQAVGSVEDTPDHVWRQVLDINLTGTWLTCKHAVPALRDSGGGTILCIASTTALHPRVNLGAYCVSKAGVGMLVRVLAREVAKDSIRVVGVCPTGVETPLLAGMIAGLRGGDQAADPNAGLMASKPVQRWLSAAEVADAIVWLTSPAAAAVTGSNIPIDFASA